jgi:tetratricopeptide (TPR) repeat protein
MQCSRAGLAIAALLTAISLVPASASGQAARYAEPGPAGIQLAELTRPREALEQFRLEQLTYLRPGSDARGVYAEIRDPTGKVHRVRLRNYMGRSFGMVKKIGAERITLLELLIQRDGDWGENIAVLERRPDTRASGAWDQAMSEGAAAQHAGDMPKALDAYDRAYKLAKGLGARDPRLALSLERMGDVLAASAVPADAQPYYEDALSVRRNAFMADPAMVEAMRQKLLAFYRAHEFPQELIDRVEGGAGK